MYNAIIIENFTNPKNTGTLDDYSHLINTGNPVCDDRLSIWVKVENGIITDTSQKAYGCATSLATSSIFSEYIKGKSVDDINNIKDSRTLAEELLGDLEPSQMHCYDIFEDLVEDLTQKITVHVF